MSILRLNCAVGDLAIVTSAHLQENVGQIVEVIGVQTGKPFSLDGEGHVWQVRAISGRATLRYKFASGKSTRRVRGPVPDHRLRLVSGLADPAGVLRACALSDPLSSDSVWRDTSVRAKQEVGL